MPTTLAALLSPTTPEQAEADLIDALTTFGFPATSWQTKSVPYTLLKWFATKYSSLTRTIASITAGGFLSTAAELKNSDGTDQREWLDLSIESQYDEPRTEATSTVGKKTLTNVSGSPYTIVIGQLWATDSAGRRYNNTTGGSLAAPVGSTLELTWKAESPGASYNIPNGTISPELATPLPGVTVTNPAVGSTGSWITTPGGDIEGNAAYAARARSKWPTLGTGAGAAAYINWARTGAPTVTRVKVDDTNPDGPGTLRVYLANAAGPATAPEIAAADAYIQPRRALGVKVTTSAAVTTPLTITATTYILTAYAATAPAQIAANVATLAASLEIGDDVFLSEVFQALSSPTGVTRVDLVAPTGTTTVPANGVVVITLQLTQVIV